jgi:NAD(P)H-hydrate repair Nnr-like enzyme with NAD(P)H-hydrate dehydratase domain
VLTPHPLEAARAARVQVADVQRDRIGAAHRLAVATGACVVLKGAGTVVALPDGRWSINASGGPILAGGRHRRRARRHDRRAARRRLAPGDAATLGAWLHGAAGDAIAARPGLARRHRPAAARLPAAIRAVLNRRAARC